MHNFFTSLADSAALNMFTFFLCKNSVPRYRCSCSYCQSGQSIERGHFEFTERPSTHQFSVWLWGAE